MRWLPSADVDELSKWPHIFPVPLQANRFSVDKPSSFRRRKALRGTVSSVEAILAHKDIVTT